MSGIWHKASAHPSRWKRVLRKYMDLNMKNATAKYIWWCRSSEMLCSATQHNWFLTFWRHYNPSKYLEPQNNTPNHGPALVETTTSMFHTTYCAVVSAQLLQVCCSSTTLPHKATDCKVQAPPDYISPDLFNGTLCTLFHKKYSRCINITLH
jgi:hypothetical protein